MKASRNVLLAALFLIPAAASAQLRVQAGGSDVNIGADGGINVRTDGGSGGGKTTVQSKGGTAAVAGRGNSAANSIGGIEGDVAMEGVAVVNRRVYIDGKEIPANVKRYKSPRTGEVYVINRKGTSVQVTTESEDGK